MPSPAASRIAVAYSFALLGVIIAGWASRADDLKENVHLGARGYGIVLLFAPLGSLVGLALVRFLVERVGPRRILLVVVPGVALAPALFSLARTPEELAAGFFLSGVFTAALQAPLNANAVYVERRYGRPIMASFHGWFSVGLLFGGVVATVAAHFAVDLSLQLGVTAALLCAGFLATIPYLPPDEPRVERPRRRRAVSAQLAILGSVALCSSLGEGTATNWSNIFMRESLGAGATLAALAYVFYACMAALSRFSSDRVLQRLGRRRFLRLAGLVAAGGVAVGLALDSVAGGFVVLAFMGVGFAAILPTIFGAAGNQPGYSASEGIATVTLLYWPAFLLGPALIGNVAQATSYRTAFFIPVLTATGIAVLAQWVHDQADATEGPLPLET